MEEVSRPLSLARYEGNQPVKAFQSMLRCLEVSLKLGRATRDLKQENGRNLGEFQHRPAQWGMD